MAIRLTSTKDSAQLHGVKMLVYGGAGSGKTKLCATLGPDTVIISAEAGLLSLSEYDIPTLAVSTLADVYEAYRFVLESADGRKFVNVAIDSISEIAEVVLAAEKKINKDPRAAYGALQETMLDLVKAFRDLPERNVYMSAKIERMKDDMSGAMLYSPMMPGNKVGQAIPYLFDEVMALRVEEDTEGKKSRWLQTVSDYQFGCKDRSGKLLPFEPPDLGKIIAKILNMQSNPI